MAQKTMEYTVGRNPEMGPDGMPIASPLDPFDVPEPDLDSEHMLINIGPQHPATHGVLRLVCELDGETVLNVTPHIGFLHSSFEKLGEYRTWNQIVPLTDRMDYLAPLIYNCAYVMAVEKLLGIEVTERAQGGAGHPHGAGPDLRAPALAGHHRHRRGRVHAVPLHVRGAGA